MRRATRSGPITGRRAACLGGAAVGEHHDVGCEQRHHLLDVAAGDGGQEHAHQLLLLLGARPAQLELSVLQPSAGAAGELSARRR